MLNAYRVLLTRARAGMVICVPYGNGNKTVSGFWEDSTRLPEYYGGTYQYLRSLGIEEIYTQQCGKGIRMTELETLERAKMYVDKLANGVNPLNDEPVDDADIVNNVRISRCLFFVSSVLEKVIGNGGEVSRAKEVKAHFRVDYEKLKDMQYSETPIGISELTDRISAFKTDEKMKKLPYGKITHWLLDKGFLTLVDIGGGKSAKRPTSAGEEIGILVEWKNGIRGPYEAVLYSISAQHFIVNNLEAILNS